MKNKKLSKTIGIFIGIKILELLGLAVATFGIYWFGRLTSYLFEWTWGYESIRIIWFVGLMAIVVIIFTLWIIWEILKKNWEWAKRLAKC